MATPGQRFELDLDADDFTINLRGDNDPNITPVIQEIREHDSTDAPPPPKLKSSSSGFPEHRIRKNVSSFKQRQQNARSQELNKHDISQVPPSDRAIANHIGKKYGHDFAASQKAEISEENTRRIAEMSPEDIEEAQAELTQHLSPAFLDRLMKRANIDEDHQTASEASKVRGSTHPLPPPVTDATKPGDIQPGTETTLAYGEINTADTSSQPVQHQSETHFPLPPRDPSTYKPLDPSSSTFLTDLHSTYFPSLPHDPNALSWLQDPTPDDLSHSSYAPNLHQYPASSLRFDFQGNLIGPEKSLQIPVTAGLHHHGDAPASAGYTIPELTLLARSTLPGQRCIAYQVIGRILYRLGRGDFGARGGELNEALWDIIEKERVIEVIMAEANKDKTHQSAKAYATEALWLWRKGGGGERGLRREGEQVSR